MRAPDCSSYLQRTSWSVLLTAFVFSSSVAAADARLPADREALLLLKVLSYDYQLKRHRSSHLRVGIVYRRDRQGSKQTAQSMLTAFRKLHRMTLQGMPVDAFLLPYRGPNRLDQEVRGNRVTTLYTASGLSPAELSAVAEIGRAHKLGTVSGVSSHVSHGIAVAVDRQGNHPQIFISRSAATAQGIEFSAQIFKVARSPQD